MASLSSMVGLLYNGRWTPNRPHTPLPLRDNPPSLYSSSTNAKPIVATITGFDDPEAIDQPVSKSPSSNSEMTAVASRPLLLFKTWQHFPTPYRFGPPTIALGDEESDSNTTCVVTNPNQSPASESTISHLQDQLAAAMDRVQQQEDLLSALQTDLREKDLLISSLSEERNEYRSLCSAFERKLGKKEGEIIKLSAKLARLDAQVGSLAQKNTIHSKPKPVTIQGADRVIDILQMDPEDGTSGFKERQASSFERGDGHIRWRFERGDNHPRWPFEKTSPPSPQDTTAKQDSEATIDRLTTKLADQASQILIITREFEKLKETRAYLEKTIDENEESMARLRINVAKEREAANEWKTLLTLSRAQPHIHGTSDLSTVGIFDAQKRRIAELEEKLSECYGQLVASLGQKDGVVLVPCNVLLSCKSNMRPIDSAPI